MTTDQRKQRATLQAMETQHLMFEQINVFDQDSEIMLASKLLYKKVLAHLAELK